MVNCTTGASMIPRWRYSPTGSAPFTSISYVGSCSSLIPTRFVVESTGNGNCNLIIPSATTAEALLYQCEDGGPFNHFMLLTIIGTVCANQIAYSLKTKPGNSIVFICDSQVLKFSGPMLMQQRLEPFKILPMILLSQFYSRPIWLSWFYMCGSITFVSKFSNNKLTLNSQH